MSDRPKHPTPEEIQKEFEEFVRKRFGDQVHVVTHQINSNEDSDHKTFEAEAHVVDKSEPLTEGKPFDPNFRYKPKEIKEYLDRFVIKQDDAKKALAIAVCDHYNHVRQSLESNGLGNYDYSKQNVMILGPTGVGKTYLVKQIAKLIGVPFVKADATRFSETGYVGSNVDDLIHDLVAQANGDIKLAQFGIVYLDEADKLATTGGHSAGKDVSGRGVQFALLKLMEESEVDLRSGNDMRAQMQAFMDFQRKGKLESRVVNTKHILFIISGAFHGLADIIKDRLNQNQIGFGTEQITSRDDEEFLAHAKTEDFIEFGFEPEFIGRMPIRVACHQLDKDDLYEILKRSEGSIVKQYIQTFDAFGIEAEFTDDALRRIAELAAPQKTGARALMTVCEQALRDFKFELPSLKIRKFKINRDVIDHPQLVLNELMQTHQTVRLHINSPEVEKFAKDFLNRHGMHMHFTEDAINLICHRAESTGVPTVEFCAELLQSYEHGLKLIAQNTGRTKFEVGTEVVENPRATLERWIRDSYSSGATADSNTECQ